MLLREYRVIKCLHAFISKDDRLPNLDVTQQGADTLRPALKMLNEI